MTPNIPETDANTDANTPGTAKTTSARLKSATAAVAATLTPRTLALLAMVGFAGAVATTAAMAERGPGLEGRPEGRGPFSMQNFDAVDADKNDKITQAEVDAYRKAEIATTDANGDGFMSADELTAMHLKHLTERAKDMAGRMVTDLDADADGKLSAAEMATRPMPVRMFDRIDTDQDGAVSKAEAQAAADRMAETRQDGPGHGPRKHRHGNN